MSTALPDNAPLAGGGETGAVMRALDWSARAPGPPHVWPEGLHAAVRLLLLSPAPLAICWGAEATLIYNEACRPLLGSRHPDAMGRPCADVWSDLARVVGRLQAADGEPGAAGAAADVLLPWARPGAPGHAIVRASCSVIGGPAPPGGVLVALHNLPDRPVIERRRHDRGEPRWAAEPAPEVAPGPDGPAVAVPAPRARILVVDADADTREATRQWLADEYVVDAVGDSVSALRAIGQRTPDVVISDAAMPGLEAREVLRVLRNHPATRGVPVILLSATVDETARVHALRDGAADYILKPFEVSVLLARLASTVQIARSRRDVEERLAATNRELRRRVMEQQTLLDVLPIGIAIATDRECREIRINRAFAEALRLSPDANASKTAPAGARPTNFRVCTPDGVEIPDRQLPMQSAARDGRETRGIELDIVHADGRIVRLLEYAAPLFDEQGSPRGAVGAFVDITASREALRQLARSEERYRRIFDGADVSIWEEDFSGARRALARLKADGVDDLERYLDDHPEFVDECMALVRIVDVNAAGVRLFNAPDKETLIEARPQLFLPETRAVFAGVLLAAARGDRRYEAETMLRTLDGRPLDALMTISFPAPDAPDERALVSLVDITHRKRTEDALHQEVVVHTALAHVGASLAGELNTDRLVQAITNAATALTAAEFGAFFYTVNDDSGDQYSLYSIAGAPRSAFAGFPHPRATDIFGPTFRGEATLRLDDVTADPRYGKMAPHHGLPPGHLPVRSYLSVPVVARGGQVLGGLFFGHSRAGVFTAQHEQLALGVASWASIALDNARLYRQVERANRLKDEFLATLSHELRTPLNAVLGWAHMLREGGMKPAMQQRAVESLERNARAQAQLVEDLLDVSRIISGKLHMKADAVDVGAVVINALDTVRASASAKRLALLPRLDGQRQLIVTGDADRLQQIVWNLVSNAIKFTPAGGHIEVELRQADAQAEIVVRDSGQGITPAFQPYLFERFRQMDASTARRHGGLGLGLSIVRHLTEAHGGTVVGESEGEGKGATFRVRLPLRQADDAMQLALSTPAAEAGPALAGLRVLVVDDEPDARELTRYILETRGASVTTAESAGEALHTLRHAAFDVLIADIGMPDQDGYALISFLRTSTEHDTTLPAIAVTAFATMPERDRALDAGYDWHLAKPVNPEQLIAAIPAVIGAAAARRRPAPLQPAPGTAAAGLPDVPL